MMRFYYHPYCPAGTVPHVIQRGDTFYKLAKKYNTTIAAIISANPMVNFNHLTIGQTLCIPSAAPPVRSLPVFREIPVLVDGELEYRQAMLEKSDLGYYLYVLDYFTFTAEEPGRDVIFSELDDRFFVRIEKLPNNVDVNQLRANAITELTDIGTPRELRCNEILDPFFRNAEFFFHASNPTISKNIILINIKGSFFRFTLFLPNVEAAEGIAPSFYAMLKTIGLL